MSLHGSTDSQHIYFCFEQSGRGILSIEVDVNGDELDRSGKAAGEWSDFHLQSVMQKACRDILATLMRVDRPSEVVSSIRLEMDRHCSQIRITRDL